MKRSWAIAGAVAAGLIAIAAFLPPFTQNTACTIAVIPLHGELYTYTDSTAPSGVSSAGTFEASSENIISALDSAYQDPRIKAVILEIDSPGGQGAAGAEIAHKLKDSPIPTIALIRNDGDSAAYWAATGAETIFASKESSVGSIGVTSSYLDYTGKDAAEGLIYNDLSSGKYKDTGSPDRPLSQAERELIMRDVNIEYNDFIDTVAANRGIDIKSVKKLADGSTMLGAMALENHLIDRLGDLEDVKAFLEDLVGDPPIVCRY